MEERSYLFGHCHQYAAMLKEQDDALTIECITIPRLSTLVHAYCVNAAGEYLDVRGTFNNIEDFLAIFDVAKYKDKREKYCEFHRFCNVEDFVGFLRQFFKDGVERYDEDYGEHYTVPFTFQ